MIVILFEIILNYQKNSLPNYHFILFREVNLILSSLKGLFCLHFQFQLNKDLFIKRISATWKLK